MAALNIKATEYTLTAIVDAASDETDAHDLRGKATVMVYVTSDVLFDYEFQVSNDAITWYALLLQSDTAVPASSFADVLSVAGAQYVRMQYTNKSGDGTPGNATVTFAS